MSENIYRKIQRQLDTYSIGFPETESGVEIEILKFLLDEEEALLFSQMTDSPESPASVASRIGESESDLEEKLEKMAFKGLLYRTREEGTANYCAAPFIHGLLEFQARDMPKELIKLTGKYIQEKLKINMAGESGMRVLPVQEAVESERRIASYDDAFEILSTQELIVAADCSCRLQHKQIGKACDAPMEACIMVGHMAEYFLENQMARRIDLDEALKIIKMCRDDGLVTQTPSMRNPMMICNCCKCCCGFLGSVRRTDKPSELIFSDYYCQIDDAKCNGCELCLDRCLVRAISLSEADIAVINHDRCIGCGLCISACSEDAMILLSKPEEQLSPPGDIDSAFSFYDF